VILEIATITLKDGNGEEFVRVMPQAFPYLQDTPGYVRHELHRGVERPDVFTLLVWWETLEAHTVTFRQSERFAGWRAVWGHLMEGAHVEHFTRAL